MLHSDSATVGGARLKSGIQIERGGRWVGDAGGLVSEFLEVLYVTGRACRLLMCPPRRMGVCVCVYRGEVGWLEGLQRTQQALRVWICVCVLCAITPHMSARSPLIIPNCVWWGLLRSQWNSTQSGLLPKSTESCPVSSDWVKEEQQEPSQGPGGRLGK